MTQNRHHKRVMKTVETTETRDGTDYHYYTHIVKCPACLELHTFHSKIEGQEPIGPIWTWNGLATRPTFDPSLKVTGVQWGKEYKFHRSTHNVAPGQPTICHSWLKEGVWEFLQDCTHKLKGQKMDMVPLPAWINKD